MGAVHLPDTPLIKEATTILKAAAPAEVLNHSMRTFLLGKAYGESLRKPFDEEGLLLAAIFHDLGLCEKHRDTSVPFPAVGSRALKDYLLERGVARERISPLCDAIDFHIQLFPRWSKGEEVGLLQVGAWMDVMGLRKARVREHAREIEAAWPRLAFDKKFNGLLLGTLKSVPACLGLVFPTLYR